MYEWRRTTEEEIRTRLKWEIIDFLQLPLLQQMLSPIRHTHTETLLYYSRKFHLSKEAMALIP